MKPFATYHIFKSHFESLLTPLCEIIQDLVNPDMLFLLGASLRRERRESIFNPTAPSAINSTGYYFLILIPDYGDRTVHEWQDMIEQHCNSIRSVTVIVLETETFALWLSEGRRFAHKVMSCAVCLWDTQCVAQNNKSCSTEPVSDKVLKRSFTKGLNRSRAFLAGAELFRVRQEYTMSAFMLHQSVEQSLVALIKLGTGFRPRTHNTERLLRYGGLVSYKLPDVFDKQCQNDNHLLSLLQKAYINARYKNDYNINKHDLCRLMKKTERIIELVEEWEGLDV